MWDGKTLLSLPEKGALPEPMEVWVIRNYRPHAFHNLKTTMTTSNQENIITQLDHVLEMGKSIINLNHHFTCTEMAAQMLAMFTAVKQVAANIHSVFIYLKENILDPFKIDYIVKAREIENLHKAWKEEFEGDIIVYNSESCEQPIIDPNTIVLAEDSKYSLRFKESNDIFYDNEEEEVSFSDIRVMLMKSAQSMCEEINNGLEKINKTLRDIESFYYKIKSDKEQQNDCLKNLEDKYNTELWENDKQRFIADVEDRIIYAKDKTKGGYERYLNNMIIKETVPYENKSLALLNNCFLEEGNRAYLIIQNKDKFTFDDIAQHFYFVKRHKLLTLHIESLDLLLPADKEYEDLFVNKASQELAFLLSSTIGMYVDFKHNYQYAALQRAMQDLGLIYSDKRNGIQMRDYVNKTYLKNDTPIKDQKTLTEWTGKLLKHKFGTMDEHNLQGNYTADDFTKMKDYYWLCLSIINKVMQLNLRDLQFAPYLYNEHEHTPNITDYKNSEGQNIMERLSFLKSVIRGESIFN